MKRNLLSLAALLMTMLFSVSAFAAEIDKTSAVGTSKEAWNATGGPVTIDGISMPEKYETTTETLGDVMWQTVEGLDNGTYIVEFYANARYTAGRGFECPVEDGALECTYLFANDVELSIPVVYNPDLNNGQSYTLENVEVTDGTLKLGMTKKAAGSNWHTIQIKSLKYIVTEDAALADAKAGLQAAIDAAKAVDPTTDELQAAIEVAQGVYDTATSVEDVNAATETLKAATILPANSAAVAGASAENPIVTNFVVNGTFDSTTAPWQTTTGAQNKALANNQTGAFNVPFFENWNSSAFTGKIYQTIENIPNGVYELSICAFVNTFDATCQYVYGNDAKTYLTTGAPTAYKVLFEVTDNTAEVGFEQTVAKANWCGIDNVSLTYYGEGTVDALAAVIEYNSALKAANEASAKDMLASVKESLDAVIAANNNVDKTDVEALTAATEALNAAVVAAAPSIKSYEILANGLAGNSLEGWTCTNTNTFQVNTWSVEGNSDGTNMVTPFLENWVGKPGPLNVGKISYTMEGIEAGQYYVSALVRVYSESGAEPAGANFFANDATVDIATGTAFEYNGMKGVYSNYSAIATVGEDGTLTFGVDITEPTFNWVAIKNIVVMKYHTTSNLDFSVGTPVDNGICTYGKDMATNNTSYYSMLDVEGWAKVLVGTTDQEGYENSALAGGIFAYGSEKWLGGTGYNVPATNPEGVAEGNALGFVAVWDAIGQYTQKITLAPGNYVITIPVYNAVGGTTAPQKSLIGFIANDGTEYLAPAKAYPVDTWTNEVITFTLDEVTEGVISLGYDAPNSGSGANQHLFIDCVKIETASGAYLAKLDLAAAIEAAQATVDAKANVGEGLFQIPTAAVDTYAAAIATAQGVCDNAEATEEELTAAIETLAAATEAYTASTTVPAADKKYTFKLDVDGDVYMNLGEKVTISETATPLSFVPAETEGQYYLTDGEYYVGLAGTDNWTMSTSADKKAAWTFTAIGEGLYRINNLVTTGRFVGTNASEVAAGTTVYADKKTDNGNVNWIIEEYVAPFEVTLINPAGETAEKIAEGEAVEFTTNMDDKAGFMLMTVQQIDPATAEVVETITSFGTPVKGESSWTAEAYNTVKFREGYNYKFTFYAYETEDAYNQEPWDAPYSAAFAQDSVEIAGALPAYVYATATLNDIKPAYGSVIENEADSVVTLTFSEPVKVFDAQTMVRENGFFAPPTVYAYTPVAVDADENGLATTWTINIKLFPGNTNVTFAAEDAEGRRVWGNMGEEETSSFSYDWECTVGVPDITIAPAGIVAGPVSTLTVSSEAGIGDFTWACAMSDAVVVNAAGEVVATVTNVEKVVDENLESYTPEWYEALNAAPNTLTLSAEITEPGTYTVKIPAGYFTVDSEKMYMSKATEAKFAVVAADKLVEVNVDRVVNLGYGADYVTVDLAAICAKLGISSISEATVYGVNATTFEYVDNAFTTCDGWMNTKGDFTTWGNDSYVCYKNSTDGEFALCTMPGNEPALGTVYTAYRAYTTATDTVILKTNITFIEAPQVQVEVIKTITVNYTEKPNTAYSGGTATFDVAAVTEALGITDITEADQYIMNVTDGSLVMNTTDGWRNAAGDAAGWGSAEKMVCVKINDPASGVIDYIGCIDDAWNEGETFTAKWAFVYDGKAVVIDVVIEFTIGTGINGISADDVISTEYYGINGAALDAPVKGINIVKQTLKNGKVVTSKVYVK